MPEPTLDAWAQIRYEYENTGRPLEHICAEHDITTPMLRYRIKRWEWRRRKPLVPKHGPPPLAVAPDEIAAPPIACAAPIRPAPLSLADVSAGDPPPQFRTDGRESPFAAEGKETIVPRLQSAVARVLPAIEATIARLAAGPQPLREVEQAGRTLSSLTRTLRELNALLGQHQAHAAEDADNAIPRDMEAFRQELARRLTAIVEAQSKDGEAKAEET